MDQKRLITLTIKSSDDPLKDQLDFIADCLRRLRRSKIWTALVNGGVWSIECTFNDATKQWHPHVHIIADGHYFPHDALKAAWAEVTGGSSIVDIRAVHSAVAAARYISAYIAKPTDLGGLPHERIQEWANAIHRRRLYGTFGTAHATTIERKTDADPDKGCETVVPVHRLITASLDGNDEAAWAIAVLSFWDSNLARLLSDPQEQHRPNRKTVTADVLDRALEICCEIERRATHEPLEPPAVPTPEQLRLFPRNA